MKELKKQNGITLIALIITIILLLILAIVTISAVNEGNLFAHANNAATKYQEEAKRENDKISELLSKIPGENAGGSGGGTEENIPLSLRKYILGVDETGITAVTEVDPENGIISMSSLEFANNATISNASTTLHYITMGIGIDHICVYFKYDEDGKYYSMSCDKTYKTTELEEIYAPSSSSNIGRTLTYDNKSYTVISDNGTELEVVANYVSDPVTIGADTYAEALTAYNSAISTLDSAAITASGLTVDGTNVKSIRSLGNSGNSDNAGYLENPDSDKFSNYASNSAKTVDFNFATDYMKLHNAGALSASSDYWLASRQVNISSSLNFYVRHFSISDFGINVYNMCYIEPDGSMHGCNLSNSVRPVLTLSSSAPGIIWD